jgi:WD40 repeat protein
MKGEFSEQSTTAILPHNFLFGRDPFETTEEFKARLSNLFQHPLLAGQTILSKEWYDIQTQRFYLHIQWEMWFKQLHFEINKVYLVLERHQAQYLYELGLSYPVYVRLRVVERPHETWQPDVIIGIEAIEFKGIEAELPVFHHTPPQLLCSLQGHGNWARAVAFQYQAGMMLASGSEDRTVKLWNLGSGQEISTLQHQEGGVNAVAFNHDGTRLASASNDTTIKIWDVVNHHLVFTLYGHRHTVFSVAFSPDSRLLASGGVDHTVRLWDVNVGRELFTLQGHTGWVFSVAFSPDGRFLASGSQDKTVKLWEVCSGQELTTLLA